MAKGETLAQLLTDTIALEVQAAEADLELRRQALAELENGTRPDERVTTGRVADLARLAALHVSVRGDAGPSLIIVGEVAARAALGREPLAEVS